VEGVGNEVNPQTQHANDDNYQIITKKYLNQHSTLLKISVVKRKQLFSFSVNINCGYFRYFDFITSRFMSINENMFGDY
jgi:hypothetical protein